MSKKQTLAMFPDYRSIQLTEI